MYRLYYALYIGKLIAAICLVYKHIYSSSEGVISCFLVSPLVVSIGASNAFPLLTAAASCELFTSMPAIK